MTKLTDAQMEEIRERYLAGGVTQQVLADEYGVARSYISRIMHGQGPQSSRFRELDDIDRVILTCINEQQGLSMVEVYRCYNLEAEQPLSEQFIRYRINSLGEMGYIRIIRVTGKPAIRRCYLAEQRASKELKGTARNGNETNKGEKSD